MIDWFLQKWHCDWFPSGWWFENFFFGMLYVMAALAVIGFCTALVMLLMVCY